MTSGAEAPTGPQGLDTRRSTLDVIEVSLAIGAWNLGFYSACLRASAVYPYRERDYGPIR
jgi:hypothetical protein